MRRLWTTCRCTWQIFDDENLDLIAAGVAFYAMLAIFPAIAALIALWGFVYDPALIGQQMALLETIMPVSAFELLNGQVSVLIEANDSTLGWTSAISLGAALWSARTGMAALIRGLNAAHGTEPRSGVRHILTAIALTLSLVAVSLVAVLALVAAPVALSFVPLGPTAQIALPMLRLGLAAAVLITGLGIVFRLGPNLRRRPPFFSAGAVFTLIAWLLVSWGLSVYLTNFGNYNEVYGSIGAVIALLMWFFLSAMAVLMGAALNAARMLEHR